MDEKANSLAPLNPIFPCSPPRISNQLPAPEGISLFSMVFLQIQGSCVFLPLSAWSHASALLAGSLINGITSHCFCRLIVQLNFPSRTQIKEKTQHKENPKKQEVCNLTDTEGWKGKGKARKSNLPPTACLLLLHSRYTRPFCWQHISPF